MVAVLLAVAVAGAARGQQNPVFVDDSTLAADVLVGLPGLRASGNEGEAVRLLQRLLDEAGDRLVAAPGDGSLYESVRTRVHRELLSDPRVLARYRDSEGVTAERMLAEGDSVGVERTRLLTHAGFLAALQTAAAHLESGRFESARLTLAQLHEHPDRAEPTLASGAATLTARVAAYIDRADTRAAAEFWVGLGGAPAVIERVAWPDALRDPGRSPESVGAAVEADSLVGTPLRSVDLQPPQMMSGGTEGDEIETRRSRGVVEYPYIFPLVIGDTVFTTDGLWISAWDRFTLTPRWQTKPKGADNERQALEEQYAARAYRMRQSRDVEEATTLSAHGRILLTATGLVTDGGRTGDPRLHAIDRETGRVLWSTYIDELDPQLSDASTRGPAVFEGDIAVVAVRKIPMAKRFASAYLVGIDLADGSARWVRLAGSAGWLAYGGRGQWTDWPVLHEGIVYRVDELGVICAVEAGTGRFRWVRRLSGVESRLPSPRVPWSASRPVIDGRTMLVLSPDRSELLRVALDTGEIVGRRDARLFGAPAYIFREGERLILVSQARIATVPIADAETAPINISPLVPDPGIIGRVVVAGGSVLLPLVRGVGVVTLADLREGRGVDLDASGNLLPLDNQLLTVDNAKLHSYLVWDRAAEILRARLDANPGDVSTAVTFAELAFRAGHPEAVLGPVDRALAAMGADPLGPMVRVGQRRLFDLLVEMLRSSPDRAGTTLPPGLAGEVVERLATVATTPDERATHRLMLASVRLSTGDVRDAVQACQSVIEDPTLASASWRRESSTVRAELEALARLDGILRAHGAGAYQPFEAAGRDALAALRARGAPAHEFESLGRSYPRASAAPAAWLEAARRHEAEGAGLAADHALARAVGAVRAIESIRMDLDQSILGEVLGRRQSSLIAHGRLDAAAAELRRIEREWPGVPLTSGGSPLDLAQMSVSLRERLDAREARPVISSSLAGAPSLLGGWVPMRALDRRDAFARRTGVVMLSAGEVGLWRFDAAEGRMRVAWTLPWQRKPALVRFDPERVLLYEPGETGGVLMAISPADGAVIWRTEPLGTVLAEAEGVGPAAGPERFTAPLDGPVSARDLILVMDETVIGAVSRSGRAVGFDVATGGVVWSRRSACHAVHDATAGEGVLVLGGTSTPATGDEAGEPIVLMLDLSTGDEISRFTGAVGQVRWVKLAPGADRVVVGLSQGLVGLSVPQAQADWVLTDAALTDSSAAWAAGDRLFVQTALLELASIDAAAGTVTAPRLDVQGRFDLGGPIDVVPAGERLLVLSPGGCVVLDAETGDLIGADAVEQFGGGLVQPAPAESTVVAFEREPLTGSPGAYRFHVLDARTGMALRSHTIELDDAPRRVMLLDEVILVGLADSTVALPTGPGR